MKVCKFLVATILSIIYLFFLQDIYSFRDNINYIISFENIQNATNIFEAFISYKGGTGASEPVYFILQYTFANIISYNFFTHILNFLFLIVLYLVIGKYFSKQLTAFTIVVLFDYYIYRLTGELHRFKVAILFFMLYLYFDQFKYKSISVFLSVLSHFQMMIVYLFFVLQKFKISRYIRLRTLLFISVFVVLLGIFFVVFKGALLSKFSYYLTLQLPISTMIIGLFYFAYLAVVNDKKNIAYFVYLFLIMFPTSFIVGADRINIFLIEFIFIVELHKSLEQKKYISLFLVIPIIFYNIFRIIGFLQMHQGFR